ncbi:MAG: hypothetical protein OJF55_000272 [Rhodanobacteraceae bacterium]|jgi:hypothetical protein|nr:MAG: hypothetical protein OJF55_000272 [Rhodanobacteraceae bacterium]
MRRLLVALGHLWTAPNTLLGLVAGLLSVPFGARPYRSDGALVFRRMPRFFGALTLGGVILHAGHSLDVAVPTYAARVRREVSPCVCLADHERAHVLQYLVLGPLFLPVYLLCGGVSARNPFEQAADRFALTGTGWWPWPRR